MIKLQYIHDVGGAKNVIKSKMVSHLSSSNNNIFHEQNDE